MKCQFCNTRASPSSLLWYEPTIVGTEHQHAHVLGTLPPAFLFCISDTALSAFSHFPFLQPYILPPVGELV